MIIKIILVCVMMLSMSVPAFAIPTLNLGPAAINASTVSFPVTLTNSAAASISGITVDIVFNPDTFALITDGANPASAAAGAAATAAGKSLYQSNPSNGVLKIVIIGLGKTIIADGTVALVSFSIKPGASTDNYTFTNIPSATDSQGNNLAITCGILAVASATTKAKVYLGTDDNFTVSNRGTTVYGSTGNDVVTIAAGVFGVILDQNIDRINLSGASSNYAFRQTGNLLNVYDASGITLILSIPVQGDTDGTVLSFNNGTASAKLTGGVMTLGGATVNSTAPGALTPKTDGSSTQSTSNAPKAKVFLGSDDSFTVSNSGITVYGGAGNNVVTVLPEISGITLDQNIGRINLISASSNYAFKQTGNMINIYDVAGKTLLIRIPVQGDSDGTLLSFSNGIASAKLTGGVMTLGGETVNSSLPSILAPKLR